MARKKNDIVIMFPSEYFDVKKVEPDYAKEYEAASRILDFKVTLFNYDEFLTGNQLKLYPKNDYQGDCIYRGWMMKSEQYCDLYDALKQKGLRLINNPDEYNTCHMFPYARQYLYNTPFCMWYKDVPDINWDVVNNRFKRFMVKDFVKSVKGTNFPEYFETPVKAKEMRTRIYEFIELRGKLYTGGIVLKEYVDLKKYDNKTNEYRAFYIDNRLLSLCRNSNQYETCPAVPSDLVERFSARIPSNYYTVDFAEQSDGKWIVLESGDGQVSGLSPNQDAYQYYFDIWKILMG